MLIGQVFWARMAVCDTFSVTGSSGGQGKRTETVSLYRDDVERSDLPSRHIEDLPVQVGKLPSRGLRSVFCSVPGRNRGAEYAGRDAETNY